MRRRCQTTFRQAHSWHRQRRKTVVLGSRVELKTYVRQLDAASAWYNNHNTLHSTHCHPPAIVHYHPHAHAHRDSTKQRHSYLATLTSQPASAIITLAVSIYPRHADMHGPAFQPHRMSYEYDAGNGMARPTAVRTDSSPK